MKNIAFLLALFAGLAHGQAFRDGPPLTAGGQSGITLPATCTIGRLFFDTDATAGQNLYGCTSANTWTAQSPNLAAPGAIGGTTPAAITGTTITATTGFVATLGTITADAAALSITRTNNDASVATGVKWTFTDTSSAAGFLPFQILGGASGTTNLLSVGKTGAVVLGGSITASGTSVFGDAVSNGEIDLKETTLNRTLFFRATGSIAQNIAAGRAIVWSSSDTDANFGVDTSASRISAGLIGVGTGAAGSTAGGLMMSTAQISPVSTALTLTAGAVGLGKMTASASAPGATGGKLELVCGTNAGSAKLVIAAGTSATTVTVVDNIGSGVTGC